MRLSPMRSQSVEQNCTETPFKCMRFAFLLGLIIIHEINIKQRFESHRFLSCSGKDVHLKYSEIMKRPWGIQAAAVFILPIQPDLYISPLTTTTCKCVKVHLDELIQPLSADLIKRHSRHKQVADGLLLTFRK